MFRNKIANVMNGKSFILTLSTVMALSVALTACSNDDEVTGSQNSRTPATLTLTSNMLTTRAADGLQATQIACGVQVGVFATAGSISNHQLTANGSGGFSDDDMTIPTGTSSVDVYAYAPYQSDWSKDAANSFSVQTDQSSDEGYKASDLLWGSKMDVSVTTSTTADITFAHKLSKVKVVIAKKSGASLTLAGAKVSIVGTKVTTTLKPSDGTLGDASGDTDDILMATLTGEDAATVAAVVVPQTVSADVQFLKIVLASNKTFNVKLSSAVTFQSGKSYVLGVELASTDGNAIIVSIVKGSEISGLLG